VLRLKSPAKDGSTVSKVIFVTLQQGKPFCKS
jgi:hypothetical protein